MRGVVAAVERLHDLLGNAPSRAVDPVYLGIPFGTARECLDGRALQGAEHARVDVALHPQYPLDKLRVRGQHADAPAGHVVRLAQRVHLDAALAGAGYRQQAEGPVVEDEAVGVVVDDDDAVTPAKLDQTSKQLDRGVGAGRHVGVVDPHEFDAVERQRLELIEVGLPPVLLVEVVGEDFGLGQPAHRAVSGVAGVGYQHPVAGVEEGEADVQDALFRADERLNFALGVEFYAIPAGIPVGKSLPQFGNAHVGLVAVGVGAPALGAERLDGIGVGRPVGAPDAQADDVETLGVESGNLFELAREVVFAYLVYPVGGPYVKGVCQILHILRVF